VARAARLHKRNSRLRRRAFRSREKTDAGALAEPARADIVRLTPAKG
jgi:hypothetical protein